MIPIPLSRALNLRPARRFIQKAGQVLPSVIYDTLSGASRVFQNMDAARQAIKIHRPDTCGHLDTTLIFSNFSLSTQLRVSDYPVLFWLGEIARTEKLRVFDFGGGVGQAFVSFGRLLPQGAIVEWVVQDLDDVVDRAGDEFFPSGIPESLRFTTKMDEAAQANVVLAAGAFHYWEGEVSDFLGALTSKPRHLIINRSPMRETGSDYFTVQQGTHWAVPCKVRSAECLVVAMEHEGYSLVDSWRDPEMSLILPFYPEFSCPYRGFYFRLASQK